TVCRRVPVLIRFGEFARAQGAKTVEDLPRHVEPFVAHWIAERAEQRSDDRRKMVAKEVRGPIEQMLRVVLSDFARRGRRCQPENPFHDQVPGFFDYLRKERGLRVTSLRQYTHRLRAFARYLRKIGLKQLGHLSPPVFSGFVAELQPHISMSS